MASVATITEKPKQAAKPKRGTKGKRATIKHTLGPRVAEAHTTTKGTVNYQLKPWAQPRPKADEPRRFTCRYCKQDFPTSYVPISRQRKPDMCLECHLERWDLDPVPQWHISRHRAPNEKKYKSLWENMPREELKDNVYKSLARGEITQQEAAALLGINQSNVSRNRRKRIASTYVRRAREKTHCPSCGSDKVSRIPSKVRGLYVCDICGVGWKKDYPRRTKIVLDEKSRPSRIPRPELAVMGRELASLPRSNGRHRSCPRCGKRPIDIDRAGCNRCPRCRLSF